ncbi:MAG: HEPN domain-containing protein [Candidatus Latescibacteria bacterium]|jgi:HEPN domain-containing protein|nr:HEPN domain-containing protein [Candidatus Latescibacterota bacterium]MBT4140182.1 HEPN domain-containing protein [Candidatus Latescibacterota bacterium]MBT5828720.1 HEPN domain-containing protein [Candidatus Latescibacterota bacterium]
MTEPQKKLVKQWVDKALNDLLNVTNNLNADHTPWDTVCFHCQQAVEKYLKAILAIQNQPIPRTHDLEQLHILVQDWVPILSEHLEDLRWLTTYAIVSRYPVEIIEQSAEEDEGLRAYAIAQMVQRFCEPIIESHLTR